MSADKEIKLKSNDEQVFTIKESAVNRSNLVKGILADYEDNTEVPLPDVNGKTLKRVVDYLTHYEKFRTKINSITGDSIDLLNITNYMDII